MKNENRRKRILAFFLAVLAAAAPIGGGRMAVAKTADGAARLVREAAAEGAVLLKNEKDVLPLRQGETVSVFGRTQIDTYKSGTGSGGMVNVEYMTNLLDGLRGNSKIRVNEDLAKTYEDWVSQNPFDNGDGTWASQPWSQIEMPVSDELSAKAAEQSETAIVVIGRTAGEESDNRNVAGSFLLTDAERQMLASVSQAFERVAAVLNVSNVMEMGWVEEYGIDAVLYLWQGGQETGNAAADLLCGDISPSGKLTDTIAAFYEAYPSAGNFGCTEENIYQEDIYVGYRYFETFAPEKVLYPFGYGLSYTEFETELLSAWEEGGNLSFEVQVTNIGEASGKEVVQAYFSAPQGVLGKPARELAAFAKTKLLKPGESERVTLTFSAADMASYDDGGYTGTPYRWVLEAGDYPVWIGNSVRNCTPAFTYRQAELETVEQLSQAMAPVQSFQRIKPAWKGEKLAESFQEVPTRSYDMEARAIQNLPPEVPQTGAVGNTLRDVADGSVSMDAFLAQLSDEDLACIVRGEGMNSPKVTSGTAAAFGGVTERLKALGIPVACATDGPSGIRLDSGETATSLPIATLLACTWNPDLVGDLYAAVGQEMQANQVDVLLAPGLNIHRDPLCGRNYEYFSEDPYVSGQMAAAELSGLNRAGVLGTIKHLAANNQETNRNTINSVVSERALREIYLKAAEQTVKSGVPCAVMSSYNPVNGVWSSSNYDLNTTILRGEWGYEGAVMTDWWAYTCGIGRSDHSQNNTGAMVRAQNDLYMVVDDSAANSRGDNTLSSLADGTLTRGELQRSAANICRLLIQTPAFERTGQKEGPMVFGGLPQSDDFDGESLNTDIWRIENEDAANWRLEDSHLIIRTQQGDFWQDHNDLKNQLVQSAFGDWGITARIDLSKRPDEEYQAVGIAAKQDDDNYIFLKYEYNSPLTVAVVQESGGIQRTVAELPCGQTAVFDTTVYLRLVKQGRVYTAYASADGSDFYTVAAAEAEYASPKFCLIASNGYKAAEAFEAGFDYVWADRYDSGGIHAPFIQGYEDRTFRPDAGISRAEVSALFARVSDNYRKSTVYTCSFPDIGRGAWYQDSIGFCERTGLMGGGSDGLFRPDDGITRAEFAAVAARFAGLPESPSGFADCERHWADGWIGALSSRGILSGYEDGGFRPEGLVTRAEAVKVMDALLGRLPACDVENTGLTDLEGHWAQRLVSEGAVSHAARH